MEKALVQNYDELYALQDSVLQIVFSEETPFYLTGGTALHRFYCNARYSDDLDFFMNGQSYFYDEVKEIIYRLKKLFDLEIMIYTKDFLRIKIEQLKIILEAAHQKESFEDCALIERLKTFPLCWLENLKLIKSMPITETLIYTICQDIRQKNKNFVFGMKYE